MRVGARLIADEWVDLLVRSIGLEPSYFDRRLKLLLLMRLVPLCEPNYNLVELGPRGTGKSLCLSGDQSLRHSADGTDHRRQSLLQPGDE